MLHDVDLGSVVMELSKAGLITNSELLIEVVALVTSEFLPVLAEL